MAGLSQFKRAHSTMVNVPVAARDAGRTTLMGLAHMVAPGRLRDQVIRVPQVSDGPMRNGLARVTPPVSTSRR